MHLNSRIFMISFPISPLSKEFFDRDTITVAKELLGKLLVHKTNGEYLIWKIVETEAYLASNDEAAHNARGKTTANQSLYTSPGTIYVHSMRQRKLIDVVTQPPESVLVRAIEPIQWIEVMKANRYYPKKDILLSNWPWKVCQAMGIEKLHDGIDTTKNDTWLFFSSDSKNQSTYTVTSSTRIGISKSKEDLLRFFLEGNLYISK